MRARWSPPAASGGVYLESFAVYLAGFLLFGIVFLVSGSGGLRLRVAAVAVTSCLAAAWPFLRGETLSSTLETSGIRRGAGLAREAGCGLLGYLAAVPLLAVAVLLSLGIQAVMARLDPDSAARFSSHPVLLWIADGGVATRVGALLLASGLAPLFEETMFRGALLAGSVRTLGRAVAVAVMALIFAVVHPQGWVAVPPLVALAATFGLLRVWRGSLVAGITAHAVHNGMLVLFLWAAMG